MLAPVGYIGYGFVGKACHVVFESNAEAIIIDPKYSEKTIADLSATETSMVFVAVSAPTLDDGTVDSSQIYSIFQQLTDIQYKGLVVLKSTLPPDTVHDLYVKFGCSPTMKKSGPLKYIYSPEFLREDHWIEDAQAPQMILMAGDFFHCQELKLIYTRHSSIDGFKKFIITDYKSAALAKYAINSYLASKVVFMNQLHQLYSDLYGEVLNLDDWEEFTNILKSDIRFGHTHTRVPGPDGKFGYGGSCFPKDVKAMISFDKHNRMTVLRETELVNTKIRLKGKEYNPKDKL